MTLGDSVQSEECSRQNTPVRVPGSCIFWWTVEYLLLCPGSHPGGESESFPAQGQGPQDQLRGGCVSCSTLSAPVFPSVKMVVCQYVYKRISHYSFGFTKKWLDDLFYTE